jgi:spore maturation protein CgeB
MKITFIGLTISSSWGNGHATTYRGLLKELALLGHSVTFLEHDKPYYATERDLAPGQPYTLILYSSVEELKKNHERLVKESDAVIVGSYVPQGPEVIDWVFRMALGVKAFYDIDTPVTLDKLANRDYEYIHPDQIQYFDMYLSFSGGRALEILKSKYSAKKALPLYCSVDHEIYSPLEEEKKWLAGYLGTYSEDRQQNLEMLLIEPAESLGSESFVIAGPGFPKIEEWPHNIEWINHLSPEMHAQFYNRQVVTINVTRKAMRDLGYSPSVRLFEAAACGIPIISDDWEGLTSLFEEGKEIFICRSSNEVIELLQSTSRDEFAKIGIAARQKILNAHTATHRAKELLQYLQDG